MSNDRRKLRRGGYYFIEGRAYPAVSTILNVLSKPGLEYWKRQQTYFATAADPTIEMGEAMAAPYRTSKRAARRGTTIHSLIEAGDKIDLRTVTPEYRPYALAYRSWLAATNPQILEHEVTLVHHDPDYAGTSDMPQVMLEPDVVYPTTLIDVKTGKGVYEESWLQVVAYAMALKQGGVETEGVGILVLKEDASYEWQWKPTSEYDDLFRVFRACWEIWHWRNASAWEKQKERAAKAWIKELAKDAQQREQRQWPSRLKP